MTIPAHSAQDAPASSRGWRIDQDFIAEPGAKEGTNRNAKGVQSVAPFDPRRTWMRFRMKDDDGNVYYAGRCHSQSFDPLWDFGTPNAGCTEIQYLVDGKWETL